MHPLSLADIRIERCTKRGRIRPEFCRGQNQSRHRPRSNHFTGTLHDVAVVSRPNNAMLNPISLLPVVIGQAFLPQSLDRTPEKGTMDTQENVDQYEGADQSKLAIVYASVLERIHRMRRLTGGGEAVNGGTAIDLCCGPGHFTMMLAKHFDFDQIVGVDLSEPMIEKARERAEREGLSSRVRFEIGDATKVSHPDRTFDVVTCNDAAHHMPDLETVGQLLCEMERLSADHGVCILSDLVRLKSESITQRYTRVIGDGYPEHFYSDFCNSMRAAWQPSELASALPQSQRKRWTHESQKLLPTVQFSYGVPRDGEKVFLRKGVPWQESNHPVPKPLRVDWALFQRLFCDH